MSRENEREKQGIGAGSGLVIAMAIVYIAVGLAMLLLDGFQPAYIVYAAGLILLAFSVVVIVRYFLNEGYHDQGRYTFSIGVFGILISLCILIKANEISGYFSFFIGVCVLITAVIKLQNAVDLKSMDNMSFIVFLIIAIIFLLAAVLIILNPGQIMTKNENLISYILIVDGGVNIFSVLYMYIAIRLSKKRARLNKGAYKDLNRVYEKKIPGKDRKTDQLSQNDSTQTRSDTPVIDLDAKVLPADPKAGKEND